LDVEEARKFVIKRYSEVIEVAPVPSASTIANDDTNFL
jgi:hypothetical protein